MRERGSSVDARLFWDGIRLAELARLTGGWIKRIGTLHSIHIDMVE